MPIALRGGIVHWAVFDGNNFFLVSTAVFVIWSSHLAPVGSRFRGEAGSPTRDQESLISQVRRCALRLLDLAVFAG